LTANTPDLEEIANLCKSSGDPLRLEILRALKTDSYNVLELCDIFDVKQSSMSHHLKILAKSNAVTTRREGNSIFYRRALPQLSKPSGRLLQALYQSVDASNLPNTTSKRITKTKTLRATASKLFFNKQGSKFQEQQELIAQYYQYADSAKDLLLHTQPKEDSVALEIGPGQGEFLKELSPLFKRVIALDISEEMLHQAQAFSAKENLTNIDFMLGDTQLAASEGIRVDHIACNMVLHHVPSPADVFQDCTSLLEVGGTFVITDLCRHDQSWAKESCGDSWLGFDPEELTEWAKDAGLVDQESLYLGLRNGFQIQVRRFDKIEL